ncbi:MAG: hypothetical protein ACTINL_06725 [Serratia proteamaculans]
MREAGDILNQFIVIIHLGFFSSEHLRALTIWPVDVCTLFEHLNIDMFADELKVFHFVWPLDFSACD